MSSPFLRAVSIALLAVFLTSFGTWNLHAKALAHELEHAAGVAHASHDRSEGEDHGHLPAAEGAPASEPPSEAEHAVLHAVGSLPAAAVASLRSFSALPSGFVRSHFIVPPVEHSTGEAPFRPPRASGFPG